ncbi:MAG: AhpC/TSA family protein [Proteobacteria bacterium]|nr:AhpC/TSA family protein [Pseudomonadota bacterium]MCP4922357.1 AhpC/TSA family protein [Pseudomonadota bacterium]
MLLLFTALTFASDLPETSAIKPSADFQGTELGLPPGTAAPDADVRTLQGEPTRLAEHVDGTTLVVFYKGGWCPFCNAHLRELATAYPEFQARGVDIVAISVDSAEAATLTAATWEIPFAVLSDPNLEAHRGYDVVWTASGFEKRLLKLTGADLEAWSGRDDGVTAWPAVFLVEEGVVTWGHVDEALKERPSIDQLLGAVAG